MNNYMESIRDELHILESVLDNDKREFDDKLHSTRHIVFGYINDQITQLMKVKERYEEDFRYLDDENQKTCQTNRWAFDKLCQKINQNDDNRDKIFGLLNQFKSSFPVRPRMVQDIPEFEFQSIDFEQLIQKRQEASVTQTSTTFNNEHSFVPVDDPEELTSGGSLGHSHHKQFAEQNNEQDFEPQSRLVSTCSTITGPETMIDLLFKVPYGSSRTTHRMTSDDRGESLLVYSVRSHQLEHLVCPTGQRTTINLPFAEAILNLGFWKTNRLFYLSTRETNRVILFRLNDKEMDIVNEFNLLKEEEHFVNVHIYENVILFLYVASSIVMLGKFDLDSLTALPLFSFRNQLYDSDEKSPFRVIDFALQDSLIAFLVQLKTNQKWMIRIYDSDSMYKLHSFDLIDADKPLSIVSTEKRSNASVSTDHVDTALLFVNDPRVHLIHCCTYEQYLAPIQVNAFAICPLSDGNLSLVTSKDIRGLKVHDYLQRNKE